MYCHIQKKGDINKNLTDAERNALISTTNCWKLEITRPS